MSENEPTTRVFTEAPASVTIRALNPAGFDILLTIRDADTAALLGRLDKALGWLGEHGYTPTGYKPANGSPSAQAGDAGEPPICKYHGKMKRSSKFAGWYCSHKLADGSGYCTEKVMD